MTDINTKLMNKLVIKTKYPIPSLEELCYFLITKRSEDLFKFRTEDKIYKILYLVIDTPAASREWHAKMAQILQWLNVVITIKDNILVHENDKEHNRNLKRL